MLKQSISRTSTPTPDILFNQPLSYSVRWGIPVICIGLIFSAFYAAHIKIKSSIPATFDIEPTVRNVWVLAKNDERTFFFYKNEARVTEGNVVGAQGCDSEQYQYLCRLNIILSAILNNPADSISNQVETIDGRLGFLGIPLEEFVNKVQIQDSINATTNFHSISTEKGERLDVLAQHLKLSVESWEKGHLLRAPCSGRLVWCTTNFASQAMPASRRVAVVVPDDLRVRGRISITSELTPQIIERSPLYSRTADAPPFKVRLIAVTSGSYNDIQVETIEPVSTSLFLKGFDHPKLNGQLSYIEKFTDIVSLPFGYSSSQNLRTANETQH